MSELTLTLEEKQEIKTFENDEEKALAGFAEAARKRESDSRAQAISRMTQILDEGASKPTEDTKRMDAAVEIVARAPEKASLRPRSAMEARYLTLPKWQREFRTMDGDRIVGRYMRALSITKNDGGALLRQVLDECKRADLLEGVSTAGAPFDGTAGELLPLPVSNYINIAFYRAARFRSLMRMTTTTTGNSLRIPRQNAISSTFWEGEADPLAQGEGTISANLNLVLKKQATLAVLSNEIIEDEVFGIVQWLINDVTMLMAEDEDEKTYGSGDPANDEPKGLEATDVIVTTEATNPNFVPTLTQVADFFLTTLIDYFHVLKMFYSLPEKERRDAIWTGPDQVALALSSIVDDQGRPIFRQQNEAGGPIGDSEASGATGTILGRPFFNLPGDEEALGSGPDGNSNRLYFMNADRTYAGLERSSVRVEASRDSKFGTDQTEYRFIRRVDGGVIGNAIAGRRQFLFTGGIDNAGTPVA